MISLYSKPEAYTTQLRLLEDYVRDHSQEADAQFLLAYHYITDGHKDDAVALLKNVVKLQPTCSVSARNAAR